MPLLSQQEIEDIFASSFFYEHGCIYIIDKLSKTYQTDKTYKNLIDYARAVRQAFLAGHTIIVKRLEKYNRAIQEKCAELGENVDVHMYLVPPEGTSSFEYHVDDRDVWVYMVYGEKEFYVRQGNMEKSTLLKPADFLFIPKGTEHKANPCGPSCLLSFGVEPANMNYKIPIGITVADLGTNPKDV